MRVEVLSPHGFCAGVTAALRKALSLASGAARSSGTAHGLYCLHELVHNELVVADLRGKGFSFVESVGEIPEGETVLFSAHGVSPDVRRMADVRHLTVVDATCPFVDRVHRAARDFAARGLPVVVIGNPDHAEVRGIVGEVSPQTVTVYDPRGGLGRLSIRPGISRIGVVSQTTMNADEVAEAVAELRKRFEVETTAEVCHATKVRQDAVRMFCRRLPARAGGVLVLGSVNSSNTRRLAEIAEGEGVRALRAGTLEDVQALEFRNLPVLGVTSGASTPEGFFDSAVAWLRKIAVAAAVVLLAAWSANADVMVINGIRYECRDGMCVQIDEAGEMAVETVAGLDAPSGGRPRLAQGYMGPEEFLAFIRGGEERTVGGLAESANRSLWLLLVLAMLGGLAMNLTPCVLPMIPVNLLIVGKSARRGIWYGLGIALAYGALGVLAAVGGLAFGMVQSNPWFNAVVAAVFGALALALCGVWTVDFARFRPGAATAQGGRLLGDGFAFLMGALNAVLAGACVAPVLVSVLLLAADGYGRGDSLALVWPFALGVGMALPWPLVGAGLKVLPQPGAWMRWVNRAFALAVFSLAAHYALLAVRGFASPGRVEAGSISPEDFPAALAVAQRPVLVDCWASWCKNCAAMERTTLADPRVREALKGHAVIRIQAEDIAALRALPGFGEVRGLPAFALYE